MRQEPGDDRRLPVFRDDPADQETSEPDPDIVPEEAARGGITVPSANQTGTTTPPISGWGETLEGEERTPEPEPER
jgi:hypothetical protein